MFLTVKQIRENLTREQNRPAQGNDGMGNIVKVYPASRYNAIIRGIDKIMQINPTVRFEREDGSYIILSYPSGKVEIDTQEYPDVVVNEIIDLIIPCIYE